MPSLLRFLEDGLELVRSEGIISTPNRAINVVNEGISGIAAFVRN